MQSSHTPFPLFLFAHRSVLSASLVPVLQFQNTPSSITLLLVAFSFCTTPVSSTSTCINSALALSDPESVAASIYPLLYSTPSDCGPFLAPGLRCSARLSPSSTSRFKLKFSCQTIESSRITFRSFNSPPSIIAEASQRVVGVYDDIVVFISRYVFRVRLGKARPGHVARAGNANQVRNSGQIGCPSQRVSSQIDPSIICQSLSGACTTLNLNRHFL